MAGSQEEIITIYRAQVDGYVKEIDAIVKKVRELTGVEEQHVKNQKIGERSLTDSAAQRKKLLNDEIANLKKLQEQSKKAFTVPEIQSFNSQIVQSKNNIALLGGETSKLGGITSGLKGQFATLGAGLLAAFSIGAIVSFGKESVRAFQEAEKSAKLLESAIKNVAGGDDSAVAKFLNQAKQLQSTTIFNDEQIQAAQTLAFQFGLTQEQVESLIPTIVDFASATGQDLQTALESVLRATEGQGRGLKVYGVTIKDTADRSKDLANITQQLTDKFQGQGEVIGDTASGKIAKFNNQLDEIKEKVGGFITRNALAPIVDTISGLVNAIGGLGDTDLEILTNQFARQSEVTKNLTDNISPLIDRYDELKSQSSLNVDEQAELEQIILKVGDALPGSITGFDKYGQAIGISTTAAREAIQAQKDLTASLNEQKIGETQKEFDKLSLRLKTLVTDLNSGTTSIQGFNNTLTGVGATATKVKLTPTDIAEFQKQATELSARVRGLGLQLKSLKGEPLVIIPNAKEEINNLEKLKDKLKSLQDDLEKLALTPSGIVIDSDEQKRIVDAITETQRQIDEVTGKAAAERIKQAEELRKTLIDEEKKTVDAINKLRIELAPTEEEKILIKAEIDRESLKSVEDDFRTLVEIQKDIDSDKIEFLKLNGLKLIQDLKAIDEKRLTDLRELAGKELNIANEARAKQTEQAEKDAADRLQAQFDSEERLQDALNQHKLALFKEGSVEQLDFQKEILAQQADRARGEAIKEFNQNKVDRTTLNNNLLAIDAEFATADLELTQQINQRKVDDFRETFDAIADLSSQLFSAIAEQQIESSQARIESLELQKEAQNDALDKELEALEDNRDRRLISEKEYETRSNAIKEQRIASEKKINEAIRAEKRKQAEISKAVAIFEATINLAQAIVTALTAGPIIGIVIAALTAALGAVQLALIISTPIPTFAKGTKDKKESGMAIVGERGEELVHLPSAAQVLPAPQTKKNREAINAMFDNNFDEYVRKKYVQPELQKEKITTQKKYEILKQVYEKQAVDNYNKSVQEKYEFTRTNALNNIVNNYVNNIISNEQTDIKYYNELVNKKNELTQLIRSVKKEDVVTKEKLVSEVDVINNKINTVKNSVEDVVKKRTELSQILSESKISHSFINNEIKKTISSEIKQTLLKNIVYNSGFEKSINTNYVSAALEENRAKLESKKQETFTQSIANSFMLSNQTNFDNEKIQVAVENGFRAATKRGVFMRNFEQLAETIADKINPDFRKM